MMTRVLAAIVALAAILAGSAPPSQAQDRRTGAGAALAAPGGQFSARAVTELGDRESRPDGTLVVDL